MRKFPGQGSNSCHSSHSSCYSDNIRSLTCCARENAYPLNLACSATLDSLKDSASLHVTYTHVHTCWTQLCPAQVPCMWKEVSEKQEGRDSQMGEQQMVKSQGGGTDGGGGGRRIFSPDVTPESVICLMRYTHPPGLRSTGSALPSCPHPCPYLPTYTQIPS